MVRLTGKDLKILLIWILIGIAGAVVATRYFYAAFPEAALNLKISKPEALAAAQKFLTANGMPVKGYESTIIFHVDENAKTYLEREVGMQEANKLIAGPVVVWYWNVRFFRPQQQEEFDVNVDPAGRVVGFSHTLEEARAGARLDREAALAIAEKFARSQYPDFASYDFLPAEASSNDRPNRRDWSFTWERRGFKAPQHEDGASYRLSVSVLGDKPGGASEFLKVPEAWQRGYQKLRSSNTFYGTIALLPYIFLNGGLVWVLFELGRRGRIRWSGALKLGFVLAVLFFAMTANNWPVTRAAYDTNSSYTSFIVQHLGLALATALALGLMVSLTVAAGEPLYRSSQPDQLRLSAAWTLPGIRSKEFFRSCVIGLAMAAGHIGFVVLFYLWGSKLGVWAPQDVPYTDVLSTHFPWLFPLTIGAYAATSEEFLFRLFAIPFLMRLTKSRVLAVVLPAFFWGFLHSAYPQQPGYIRGIEVGVIGIVAGVVMLRYGILATLVWHYTVDAMLIGLFLLRSGNVYFRTSGALVGAAALIPLVISGWFYLARRGFEPDEGLLNRDEVVVERPAPIAEVAAPEPVQVESMSARQLKVALACGAAGLLLAIAVKPHRIGDFLRFSINATQAAERGDAALRARGVDPRRYHRVATLVNRSDGYVNEFLRRKIGIAGANRVFETEAPLALWRVRYFRDGEKEEYWVVLRPDGALHSVHHNVEEKAPGVKLSREQALAVAETYLRREKQLDLARWKLVDARADARPARTDHDFVWEQNQAIAGTGVDAAHVRTEVNVTSDQVSGYRVFVKIPEQWEREQQKRTLARVLQTVWTVIFLAGIGVAALVLFFKNLRLQTVPWRRLAKWALAALAGSAIVTVSNLPSVIANYPTAIPLTTFKAVMSVSLMIAIFFGFASAAFLFGLAWFYLARAFGENTLPSWRGMPANYYRDALVIGAAGTAALAGLARVGYLVSHIVPMPLRSLDAAVPSGLDSLLPAAQAVGHALSTGVLGVAFIGLAAGFVACHIRGKWAPWALIVGAALAATGDWGSAADFARQFAMRLVLVVILWVGVRRLVQFNMMGYFLVAAVPGLLSAGAVLIKQPNSFFRMNGWAVMIGAVVLLAWPVMAWHKASKCEAKAIAAVAP